MLYLCPEGSESMFSKVCDYGIKVMVYTAT